MPYRDPEIARQKSAERMRRMRARVAGKAKATPDSDRVRALLDELQELRALVTELRRTIERQKVELRKYRTAWDERASAAEVFAEQSAATAKWARAKAAAEESATDSKPKAKPRAKGGSRVSPKLRVDMNIWRNNLGLDADCMLSKILIKAAYRARMKQMHPDAGGDGNGMDMAIVLESRDKLLGWMDRL